MDQMLPSKTDTVDCSHACVAERGTVTGENSLTLIVVMWYGEKHTLLRCISLKYACACARAARRCYRFIADPIHIEARTNGKRIHSITRKSSVSVDSDK